ncbi:hypothetical protein [Methanolobus sp. WCC4]|uniref:hypothetical protein n=1 Tax=Methanolobus sp. WCC4 TaxID=3125784 RepID=UPI0030F77BB1
MNRKTAFDVTLPIMAIERCIPMFFILCICSLFLITPAIAFPDDADNSSASTIAEDVGITEYSHLIEMYFEDDNYILVGESVVYSTGSANESGELVFYVPENANIMYLQVTDMAGSIPATSVNYSREDDFIYFSPVGLTGSGGMPLIYDTRYTVHSHEEVPTFNKVIRENGVLDYPISRLIIVVNHDNEEIPSITSADGIILVADEVMSGTNKTSYIWSSPDFDEVNVILEKHNTGPTAGGVPNYSIIVGIILLVIVIAAVLYYKKGSSGKLNELEDIYEAELVVLAKIDEDRKKKKLSKEDFERIHKKHSDNAEKIKQKMEKLKRT